MNMTIRDNESRLWLFISAAVLLVGLGLLVYLLFAPYHYPVDTDSSGYLRFGEEEWREILTVPEYRLRLMSDRKLARAVADIPLLSNYTYAVQSNTCSTQEFIWDLLRTSNASRALLGRERGGTELCKIALKLAEEALTPEEHSRVYALCALIQSQEALYDQLTLQEQEEVEKLLKQRTQE